MHITFYNSNNAQILQQGDGYVMEYSGKDSTYTYYRMAIPTNAAKFALNNGYKSTVKTVSGTYYDILRLDTVGSNSATDYTKDKMVYELTGNNGSSTLNRVAPTFTVTASGGTPASITAQSDNHDYTVRGTDRTTPHEDYLNIRDDNNWNIGIGYGKVKFYDENGTLITGDGTGGNGTYTLMKTIADSNSKVWYKVSIPQNAKTFSVSYTTSTTPPVLVSTPSYDIYPYGASGTEGNHTETGNMYYQTESGGKLSLITVNGSTPITTTSTPTNYHYTPRPNTGGDNPQPITDPVEYLYFVTANKNEWKDMTVIFDNGAITPKTPEYLGEITYDPVSPVGGVSTNDENAAGHWFRIPIPDGAMSFIVTGLTNSVTGTIFEWREKPTRYAENWTTDGMQYRLPDSTGKPTLLYPVFTEEELQSVEVGGQTIYTEESVKVDLSQIEDLTGATPAQQVEKENQNVSYPVLYQTDDSKVTYEWTVDNVYFRNDQNWSTVTCKFYNGSDVVSTQSATGSGIKSFAIPNATVTKVEFSNGSTSCDFTLSNGRNDAINKICEYVSSGTTSGWEVKNRIYFKMPRGSYYYNNTNVNESWNNNKMILRKPDPDHSGQYIESSVKIHNGSVTGTKLRNQGSTTAWTYSNDIYYFNIDPSDGWTQVKFYDDGNTWSNNNTGTQMTYSRGYTNFVNLTNNGTGNYFEFSGSYYDSDTGEKYQVALNGLTTVKIVEERGNVTSYTWQLNNYDSGSFVGYSANYQPEDRYSYINDVNAVADENNFIKIVTGLTAPYINFFDGNNAVIGTFTPASANGIALNYDGQTGTGAVDNPYVIRLPRGATKFTLTSGSVSVTQNLYEDGFHHAGTTFTIDNSGNVTDKAKRNATRSELESDVSPRTDGDYVFFTDTGSFANSDTVYAYFYGDVDGEYAPWPGVKASTTTQDNTVYTDNSGKKVYKFRIPKGSNGKYSKVIFTDGESTDRKITKAMDIQNGKNYVLGEVLTDGATTPANIKYGSFSKNVYDVETQDKASGNTNHYSGTKTIYIINNGTQNTASDKTNRTQLDEIHVTFYDANKQVVGTANAGYLPDRLGNCTYDSNDVVTGWTAVTMGGKDVYKITVPSTASYFQINNGINKGTGTSKERYSVIEPVVANGLYKFVESTTATDITQDTFPATEADRYKPKYELTLVNKVKQDDDIIPVKTEKLKLATAVTDETAGDNQGKIKYIKWLKPETKEGETYNPNDSNTYVANTVDKEYLNHEFDEVGETAGTKQVKVVKKGTYYWVETTPPTGYKPNDKHIVFEVKDDGVYYYDENNALIKVDKTQGQVMTLINEKQDEPPGEVIFTKTAKEKVGTIDIGDALAGAKFLVKKASDDSATGLTFSESTLAGSKAYVYGSGSVNTGENYLETGADGKLHIKGLPIGDYYLEEQEAPNGYSHLDSSTGTNKKISFSIGENREVKEITAADEMEPAYIRLFEHINEWRPNEWGNPTFIFKITQTMHYGENENDPPTWSLVDDTDRKEIIVALTVNDDGTIKDWTSKVLKWVKHTETTNAETHVTTHTYEDQFFDNDPISDTKYGNWFVEATSENEYIGLFNIDEQGRIRVEPGKYEVTRLPVSRYEFVTSGHIVYNTDPDNDPYYYDTSVDNPQNPFIHDNTEKVTIAELKGGETADVHYYDKVAYYDKFSQVTEKINSLHQYTVKDENDKDVTKESIKGIRIADYSQKGTETDGDTDSTTGDMTIRVADLTIYKILADGKEVKMTDDEKSAVAENIAITYTFAEKDDKKFGGSTADSIQAQFSYDEETKTITVTKSSDFAKGVYTLKANYKGFEDEFDIVFKRS